MPHASTSPRAIATKLCIDQLLFAPVCTLAFYGAMLRHASLACSSRLLRQHVRAPPIVQPTR